MVISISIVAILFVVGMYWLFSPRMTRARDFCKQDTTSAVYIKGKYIQVVSKMLGGGSSYYDANGKKVLSCPLVSPEFISEACKNITGSSVLVCKGK